ncbi:MAG: enhanced serine sensitivity protein SseB C-terminal domain-containing protein [Leucothrix sp.]
MLLPANKLEQALHQAAIDEKHVEDFYSLLMESRVFILGKPAAEIESGDFVLTDDDELLINHWETEEDKSPVIPFFTSLQTLQKTIPEDEPYLEVPTEALFRMTLGVPMVLNPNTEYGMEFAPEDVVSLLGSDSLDNQGDLLEADDDFDPEGIYLDVLLQTPEMLVAKFCEVMGEYAQIEMAYLAVIHEPSVNPEPHLLVGIKGNGSLDTTIEAIANRITEADNDSDYEMFDFFTITEDDPDISDFLTEHVEPFYTATSTQIH